MWHRVRSCPSQSTSFSFHPSPQSGCQILLTTCVIFGTPLKIGSKRRYSSGNWGLSSILPTRIRTRSLGSSTFWGPKNRLDKWLARMFASQGPLSSVLQPQMALAYLFYMSGNHKSSSGQWLDSSADKSRQCYCYLLSTWAVECLQKNYPLGCVL